ncbi:MAG TPA: hypothetical protein VF516_24300, partial [Kofleriaceae bacterium]
MHAPDDITADASPISAGTPMRGLARRSSGRLLVAGRVLLTGNRYPCTFRFQLESCPYVVGHLVPEGPELSAPVYRRTGSACSPADAPAGGRMFAVGPAIELPAIGRALED